MGSGSRQPPMQCRILPSRGRCPEPALGSSQLDGSSFQAHRANPESAVVSDGRGGEPIDAARARK